MNNKFCWLYTPYVKADIPPPECYFTGCKKKCKIFVGDHICVNGREYKYGKWRITPRALWEYLVGGVYD